MGLGPTRGLDLVSESKPRMIVAQVIDFLRRKLVAVIAFTGIPRAILVPQSAKEDGSRNYRKPEQTKTHTKTDRIRRRLIRDINIARNNPTEIAKAELNRRGNGALIVACHVVTQPADSDGLRDIAAAGDEVDAEIADSDTEVFLAEEDGVADCGYEHAGYDEGVAVF